MTSAIANEHEMVLRVAAAMKKVASKPLGNLSSLEPALVGSLGDAWPYLARAAIKAMRNPTETMCQAGLDTGAVDNDEFYLRPDNIETVYVAMIDEILK